MELLRDTKRDWDILKEEEKIRYVLTEKLRSQQFHLKGTEPPLTFSMGEFTPAGIEFFPPMDLAAPSELTLYLTVKRHIEIDFRLVEAKSDRWILFPVLARISKAVREHPREYLAHRLRTTQLVFGRHDGATAGLAYYTDRSSYRDNPPLPEILNPRAHQGLLDLAARLRPTWVFSAWPYLLAHLGVLILAWRGRQDPRAALVLGVTSSALVYAASFIILAPSAELRFVTWPIVSATLAIALWFAPMPARHPDARSGGAPGSGPARPAAG